MIFNKTKKGSAELYNLTGTWYKANDFTGISEDIVLAQNEVIKLIGKATFDRAHSRYMTDEYDPEVSSDDPEDMLVRRVQLPVAYKAMHHFYQRNLVSHEDSGRKVKISEKRKTAVGMADREGRCGSARYILPNARRIVSLP